MIRKLVIRRFKRFDEEEFLFPGHLVIAGPNNSGKTTVLQAAAAWSMAFDHWTQLGDFQRRRGAYTKAPIPRPNFWPVPVRSYDHLWPDRELTALIEIELQHARDGWTITMELLWDTQEQILVRPKSDIDPTVLRSASLSTVLVPSMSGLSREEPLYARRDTVDALLGQARPGDVLRNLLYQCSESGAAWDVLCGSIKALFGFELLRPVLGPFITAEYRRSSTAKALDIASAGSGFQQVLMLLTFLHTRPGAVLLLDEPDAHLHVILQDAIYSELRRVAVSQASQLIIATHSEVIINAAEPRELCILLNKPKMVADVAERRVLIDSLRVLSNEDIMLALEAPGVLYLEDYTDLVLRAWAEVLQHPTRDLFERRLYWKKTVVPSASGTFGVQARDHYAALQLVRPLLPGLELIDGDGRPEIQQTAITGTGLQRLRWHRYEIESYLVHPGALARWVRGVVGDTAAETHVADLHRHFVDNYPPPFLNDPLIDHPMLLGTKARTALLPPALAAAGLPDLPYTRYAEIARMMLPSEIHPEVKEKLDLIQKAFNL